MTSEKLKIERTLKRELRLGEEEVAEAIRYWLVNKQDIQIGGNFHVEFKEIFCGCIVTSTEDAIIEVEY